MYYRYGNPALGYGGGGGGSSGGPGGGAWMGGSGFSSGEIICLFIYSSNLSIYLSIYLFI